MGFQRSLGPGLFIDLPQETQRRRIGLVDPDRFLQQFPGFLIFAAVDVKQRQQVISLDELRVLGEDLLQLDQ